MADYTKATAIIDEARAELKKGSELDDVFAKFGEAVEFAENNPKLIAMAKTGQGEVRLLQKAFEKAEECMKGTSEECGKEISDAKVVTHIYYMQGLAFMGVKNFEEAGKSLEKAKEMCEAGKLPESVLKSICGLIEDAKNEKHNEDSIVEAVKAHNEQCESSTDKPEPAKEEEGNEDNKRKRKASGNDEVAKDNPVTPEKKARDEEAAEKPKEAGDESETKIAADSQPRAEVATSA